MRTELALAWSLWSLCTACGFGPSEGATAVDGAPMDAGTVGTGTMGAGPTSGGNGTGGPITGASVTSTGTGGPPSTTGGTSVTVSSASASSSDGATSDVGASSGGATTAPSSTTNTVATGTGGSGGSNGGESPGCGSQAPLESGTFSIDVDGTERSYILDVPAAYDTNHPYRLVFTWHWLGGSATAVVDQGYYGLKALAGDTAIFVSPDGLEGSAAGVDGQGWYNTNGGDIKFLRAMLDHFNQNACIDQGRIFSTGFSFGGMMSNAIGCELADVFRAIAPMSGNLMGSGCQQTTDHPIAYLGIHGDDDTFVTTESGRAARDVFVARNHCQSATEPSEPSVCVAYTGCDDGYPVSWCEWSGAHSPWPDAAEPIWTFFEQF